MRMARTDKTANTIREHLTSVICVAIAPVKPHIYALVYNGWHHQSIKKIQSQPEYYYRCPEQSSISKFKLKHLCSTLLIRDLGLEDHCAQQTRKMLVILLNFTWPIFVINSIAIFWCIHYAKHNIFVCLFSYAKYFLLSVCSLNFLFCAYVVAAPLHTLTLLARTYVLLYNYFVDTSVGILHFNLLWSFRVLELFVFFVAYLYSF